MVNKPNTNQEQFNAFLISVLKKGFCKSGIELNEALVGEFGVTPQYARQILKRSVEKERIKSSAPHMFGTGQYVYFLSKENLNLSNVLKICKKYRPPIYRLLELMQMNGGIVSIYEALKITSTPIKKNSAKISLLSDIERMLTELSIIYRKKDENNVEYLILYEQNQKLSSPLEKQKMSDHYNKMVTDCTLIPDVLRWLINSNIIGNSQPIYRNKKTPGRGAVQNNLVWDAYGYTKATGINPSLGVQSDNTEKQTLVVLDVVLSYDYTKIHLDAFFERIQHNRHSTKGDSRKILPIVVYKSASQLVINTLGKLGIIAFDINSIFGTKIIDILLKTQNLVQLIDYPEDIEKEISGILKTISNAGQEDALRDLKGTLFEFLMYPLIVNLYPQTHIERGKILSSETVDETGSTTIEKYEYDYIVVNNNPPELIFIELKGYNSGATIPLGDRNTKSSLKWFFRRTLPFGIKQYDRYIKEGKVGKGVFITSANFYPDGHDFITTINKSKLKPLQLEAGYERQSLIKLLTERGFKNEVKIIEKFYTKEAES